MISLNEFLIKGKIDKTKQYKVYKLTIGYTDYYYVKVDSYNDIVTLCKDNFSTDTITKINGFFQEKTYKLGVFIRPIKDKKNNIGITTFWCSNENDFNKLEYITNINVENFTIEYWKSKNWTIDL